MTRKYWAKFDSVGAPQAFYVSDIWPEQPDGTAEISENQWREFIDNPGLRRWDGTNVVVYAPPVEPQPEPVITVSPYQARVALLNAGLLDTVETAINSKGGKIKIKWDYATEVRSDDSDLLDLATELGIADQIPALFQAAQQVT